MMKRNMISRLSTVSGLVVSGLVSSALLSSPGLGADAAPTTAPSTPPATPMVAVPQPPAISPAAVAPAANVSPRVEIFAFTPVNKADPTDWIGRGIQENLQTDISRTGATLVLPTHAAATTEDPIAAARQDHADLAVIGTYQVVGDQVRVNAHLMDVATNAAVGGFSSTGAEHDLFKVEDALGEQLRSLLPRPMIAPAQPAPDTTAAAQPASPTIIYQESPTQVYAAPPTYESVPDYYPDYYPAYSYYDDGYGYGYPFGFYGGVYVGGGYRGGYYHGHEGFHGAVGGFRGGGIHAAVGGARGGGGFHGGGGGRR